MFSASVEIVLAIAYREAVSRRHAYVTLEHLLYALAHDPDGERILIACGADTPKLRRDLDAYLEESIVKLPRGQERQPEQTTAFSRVLQTAVLHVQSAQRQEVHAGDICAALLQQPKSEAARLLLYHAAAALDERAPGATRLAAMAKRLATDTGFEVVNGCLQLHGGYGYLRDHPIERVLRDVRAHQILEGTNEVMRLIVSRDILGN